MPTLFWWRTYGDIARIKKEKEDRADADSKPIEITDTYRALAVTRSHEDAKLANTLFQQAGQSFTLINGGAATATLTFATARPDTKKNFNADVLSLPILLFAIGVLAGALAIIFQAVSTRHYAVRWQRLAAGEKKKRVDRSKRLGDLHGLFPPICILVSAILFLAGSIELTYHIHELINAFMEKWIFKI